MTMITPSYLGETIEYSSLHACRSTLEDPTGIRLAVERALGEPSIRARARELADWNATHDAGEAAAVLIEDLAARRA